VTDIITVKNLVEVYADGTKAVDDISFDVQEREFFGFLGPNGAGKSTTIKILTTLLRKTSGSVTVAGFDIDKNPPGIRKVIGVQSQDTAVDPELTGRENMILQGHLQQMSGKELEERVDYLLGVVGLKDAADKRAGRYSGGMKKRLDLASTLVHKPRVLFLDEPTTGLDPRGRRTMWQIIRDLVDRGVTIFLTTQDLAEADRLADRIGLLEHGKIVAEGTADELKHQIPGGHIRLQFADAAGLDSAARDLGNGSSDEDALTLQIPYDGSVRSLRALLSRLDDQAIPAGGLSVHTPDLDDVFFALTGHSHTEKDTPR